MPSVCEDCGAGQNGKGEDEGDGEPGGEGDTSSRL